MEKEGTIAHLKINKKLFVIDFDEIKIDKIIGTGGSDSVVFKAFFHGQIVAFKCFRTNQLMSDQESFDQFEDEVNILANINHPNIIRFFGASLKPPRVGILMELCENGEILEFLHKYNKTRGKRYPLKEKMVMVREIISAVVFIHSRNIIHRDLKPENVLVDSSFRVKLMDFGISKVFEKQNSVKTKRIGTGLYMAPEVLRGVYDQKVDTFSFGIMLWVLFTENKNPYGNERNYQIEFQVANNPSLRPDLSELPKQELLENNISMEWMMGLLENCWNHDPFNRYDFKELAEIFEKQSLKVFQSKEKNQKVPARNYNTFEVGDRKEDGSRYSIQ